MFLNKLDVLKLCFFVGSWSIKILDIRSLKLIGNTFLDPVWHVTHNDGINAGVGNENYSEHNYFYYRGLDGVDFRAKNIDSFESVEKNSIDLYASVKSLYLQNRNKKISNSTSIINTQDDSDWEEINTE